MPLVKTDWGWLLEPPYSEEEQMEIYRRTAGVVSFSRVSAQPLGHKSTPEPHVPEGHRHEHWR